MSLFSNELPSSEDYGTPEWNAKYDELQKVITEKLGRSQEQPDCDATEDDQ